MLDNQFKKHVNDLRQNQDVVEAIVAETPEKLKQGRIRCRKIKMILTWDQRKILDEYAVACKKTWNKSLDHIRKNSIDTKRPFELDKYTVTAKCQSKSSLWLLRTPSAIRKYANRSLKAAFKTGHTNVSRGWHKKFNIREKRYRDSDRGDITFEHQYMTFDYDRKRIRFYTPDIASTGPKSKTLFTGWIQLKWKSKNKNHQFPRNCSAIFNRDMKAVKQDGEWFLCVPYARNARNAKTQSAPPETVISLDPGHRMFYTGYSPSSGIEEFDSHNERLEFFFNKLKSIESHLKDMGWRLTRAKRRLKRRVKGLIDDFQWKTCHKMLQRYSHIVLPRSFSSRPIQKLDVSISMKWMARQQKHCQMRDRLVQKSEEYPGSKIWFCSEEYTTQTCGQCGTLNNPGCSKIYKCLHCGFVADRDHNAARNIFLKAITAVGGAV